MCSISTILYQYNNNNCLDKTVSYGDHNMVDTR